MYTPQRPRHPQPEGLGGVIVRAGVRGVVVVDIEVVEETLASLGRRCLHLVEEPWEEVHVIVRRIVREPNRTRPIC